MSSPSPWHPVLAAHELRAGQNIVGAVVRGRELALWRSDQGTAQAWENRCPHRGVRLTLGRLVNGRLACGYHGWEYAAGTGRCEAIPALADIPVPGRVCVRTYQAVEAQSMVWVRLEEDGEPTAPAPASHGAISSAAAHAPPRFLRTLALRAGLDEVVPGLARHGLVQQAPASWSGTLAQVPLMAYLLDAEPRLCLLHLWVTLPAAEAPTPALFAAVRRLRADLEAGPAA